MATNTSSIVRDNVRRVQARIAAAAERCGRSASEITLVGVTKYVDAPTAAALVAAGCFDLGESRPQQLWEKEAAAELAELPVRWHLIGHLQRNKVARTAPIASLIHSVDSTRLLRAINDAATREEPADVLLEVNTSGDEQKHGLTPDQARGLVEKLNEFPNCRVRGLMTMAAREGGPDVAQRNFAALRQLRDELQAAAPAGVVLKQLSMGMSGDFEEAIAEGATIVRVGSALWEGVAQRE